ANCAGRPHPVLCQSPHRSHLLGASHRDHRIVGGVTLDCIYPLARDHMAFPELMPMFEPHKVREVHVMQWENPQIVVDISDTMDLKIKALACQDRKSTRLNSSHGSISYAVFCLK